MLSTLMRTKTRLTQPAAQAQIPNRREDGEGYRGSSHGSSRLRQRARVALNRVELMIAVDRATR